MLNSIWDDVRQQFRFGNRVTQLILVNVVVFVVFGLLGLVTRGIPGATAGVYQEVERFFSLSNDWLHNLTHPWSLFTYSFLHAGLRHVFWNLLLFYWFGRIVGDLIGNERILPLYFWGAVAGGLSFWISAAVLPYGADGTRYIVGASASVMATIVAAAAIAPEYVFRVILIGEVRLKYIALALILVDLFAFGADGNTGGHFAHVGGMVMGYAFVAQLRQGNDLAEPVNRVVDAVRRFSGSLGHEPRAAAAPARGSRRTEAPPPRARAAGRRRAAGPADVDREERLDAILAKIKAEGIKSLSAEERDFLSLASRERT